MRMQRELQQQLAQQRTQQAQQAQWLQARQVQAQSPPYAQHAQHAGHQQLMVGSVPVRSAMGQSAALASSVPANAAAHHTQGEQHYAQGLTRINMLSQQQCTRY